MTPIDGLQSGKDADFYTMEWIDTHTHLYVDQFDDDREEIVGRALNAGVSRLYLPNIDRSSIGPMLDMEARWPDVCFPMMGLHPCSVGKNYREELDEVRQWLEKRTFAAVGEIGLDFYWDKTFVRQQEEVFLLQAGWAVEFGLPIVIHSRDSIDRNIELLEEASLPGIRGVFHCFTGTVQQAERILDLGFYLGIGGVLTFKNAGLDKVIAQIGPERLVLETDSPYLAPVPFRGKRNESAYVVNVAEKLAGLLEMPLRELAEITTRNARALFPDPGTKTRTGRI